MLVAAAQRSPQDLFKDKGGVIFMYPRANTGEASHPLFGRVHPLIVMDSSASLPHPSCCTLVLCPAA